MPCIVLYLLSSTTKVLLVTGGFQSGGVFLDSTELMEADGTWRMTAPLPAGGSGVRAAVVDNSLLVFGG